MDETRVNSLYNENFKNLKKELKLFTKLHEKGRYNAADIRFINLCLKNQVTPQFVRKTVKFDGNSYQQKAAEKKVLQIERNKHYQNLSNIDLALYGLHLKLVKHLGHIFWENFEGCYLAMINTKMSKKTMKLKKKFSKLTGNQKETSKNNKRKLRNNASPHENVVNLSRETFTKEEMNLLSKGLKTCVGFSRNIEEYIVDIQVATHNLNQTDCNSVQSMCGKVLEKMTPGKNHKINVNRKIIDTLKNKNVVYTKADKGNSVVILDNEDYKQKLVDLLEQGQYLKIQKNPLSKCKTSVNNVLKNVKIIPKNEKFLVKVDNPTLPRIYGLPKIHKPKLSMRPIINNINSPTYKLARWLSIKYNSLQKFESASIKNSIDLIDKIKNIDLNSEDRLVSFDVEALFPSIPVEKLMKYLEKWLNDIGLQKEEVEDYIELTKICVGQNYFSFDNKFYKQDSGLSMGNPLSPFLANLFMSFLETHLIKAFPYMFKTWHRYVDDIVAIIPNKLIQDALKLLNIQDNSLKFTLETEIDGQLPFLDLKIKRNSDRPTFGIYIGNQHTQKIT